MKKTLFLIVIAGLVFMGWQQYQQRKAGNATKAAIIFNTNSEIHNTASATVHCIDGSEVNQITNRNYTLENEVYTPAVTLLECSYKDNSFINSVFPVVRYKVQLTANSTGIWNKNKATLQASPSYREAGEFPNAFAHLNPVREVDQGTFYGKNDAAYVELSYTPVSEGADLLFSRGMKLLEKALSN